MKNSHFNLECALEARSEEPTKRPDDRAEDAERQRMQQERIHRDDCLGFTLK